MTNRRDLVFLVLLILALAPVLDACIGQRSGRGRAGRSGNGGGDDDTGDDDTGDDDTGDDDTGDDDDTGGLSGPWTGTAVGYVDQGGGNVIDCNGNADIDVSGTTGSGFFSCYFAALGLSCDVEFGGVSVNGSSARAYTGCIAAEGDLWLQASGSSMSGEFSYEGSGIYLEITLALTAD